MHEGQRLSRAWCVQVRKLLENDDALQRLRAVRRYGRSMAPEDPKFPPAPLEVPPYQGPMLEQWGPKPPEGVEVLVP